MKKAVLILFALFFTATSLFAELDKEALFGKEVFDKKGKAVSTKTLNAKVYGIYFSAHWCPPCRTFSPMLVDTYNSINSKEKQFEIIFVSSDKNSDAQFAYMEELKMPWYTVTLGSKTANELKKKYKVTGIPKFVVIDANGKLITENGRNDVSQLKAKAYEKWIKAK